MTAKAEDQARLYYALWPDEPTLRGLEIAQADLAGRKTQKDQLHLTLAFLGNQPIGKLPALAAVLEQLPQMGFVIELDRYGYFNRPQIAWIGPSEAPSALLDLRESLLVGLSREALRFKDEARFVPHVTLARDAETPTQQVAKRIGWTANRVVLVQSLPTSRGVIYSLIAERLLDGAVASVAPVAPAS
jgi:2'-5' RNA ligase